MSAFCRAVGVPVPNDSEELHKLPLVIRVARKKQTGTGEIVNEIQGYSQKEAPPVVMTASINGSPPWKRLPLATGRI